MARLLVPDALKRLTFCNAIQARQGIINERGCLKSLFLRTTVIFFISYKMYKATF